MEAEKQVVKKVRIPKAHSKTLAAKIRYLNEQGLSRADIARQLDVRYQRVRNVLVPRKVAEAEIEAEAEVEDEPADAELELIADEA
jgi:orotate phosphoribosyltransferase-like protein